MASREPYIPRRPGTTAGQPPAPQPAPRQSEDRTRRWSITTTLSVNYGEFHDEVMSRYSSGWQLEHLTSAPSQMGPLTAVYYTAVWRKEL